MRDRAAAPLLHTSSGMSEPVHHVALPGRMEMAGAAALRERLLDALASGAPVHLDGRAVESVDSASAQVLVAFALSAREAGREVSRSFSGQLETYLAQTALIEAFR